VNKATTEMNRSNLVSFYRNATAYSNQSKQKSPFDRAQKSSAATEKSCLKTDRK